MQKPGELRRLGTGEAREAQPELWVVTKTGSIQKPAGSSVVIGTALFPSKSWVLRVAGLEYGGPCLPLDCAWKQH